MTLRRLAAFFIDWLFIIAYAALLIPLGILLYDRVDGLPTWALNAGAFVLLVVPATVWLAGWERGGRRATPGKRVLRLRVLPVSGGALGWWRSLARNGLKLALPWELGHTSVYAFQSGSAAVGIVCAVLAYGLLFVYLGYALASGRTPYDRLTGSTVERVAGLYGCVHALRVQIRRHVAVNGSLRDIRGMGMARARKLLPCPWSRAVRCPQQSRPRLTRQCRAGCVASTGRSTVRADHHDYKRVLRLLPTLLPWL